MGLSKFFNQVAALALLTCSIQAAPVTLTSVHENIQQKCLVDTQDSDGCFAEVMQSVWATEFTGRFLHTSGMDHELIDLISFLREPHYTATDLVTRLDEGRRTMTHSLMSTNEGEETQVSSYHEDCDEMC